MFEFCPRCGKSMFSDDVSLSCGCTSEDYRSHIAELKERVQDLETRARVKAVFTFERRVEPMWIDPSKSVHYSARPDGTPYIYEPFEPEPARLYSAVIVPQDLVGQVIKIRRADIS